MVFDLSPYMNALSTGVQASSITGSLSDTFPVGAYSAWVQSITGSTPSVVDAKGGRVKLVLSQTQAATMRKWLDGAITGLAKTKEQPRVSYELGPVVKPIFVKYAVPSAILFLVAGFVLAKTVLR